MALEARPRGGDWLADDLARWRMAGIATVVSLLTAEEERDLDLVTEHELVAAHGMQYISLPIPDRDVPSSPTDLSTLLAGIESELRQGRNVLLHCRQGIGRTGLVAACALVGSGMDADRAIDEASRARGVQVPETGEQRAWVKHFAESLAHAR